MLLVLPSGLHWRPLLPHDKSTIASGRDSVEGGVSMSPGESFYRKISEKLRTVLDMISRFQRPTTVSLHVNVVNCAKPPL